MKSEVRDIDILHYHYSVYLTQPVARIPALTVATVQCITQHYTVTFCHKDVTENRLVSYPDVLPSKKI